jgi:hypothetical protein
MSIGFESTDSGRCSVFKRKFAVLINEIMDMAIAQPIYTRKAMIAIPRIFEIMLYPGYKWGGHGSFNFGETSKPWSLILPILDGTFLDKYIERDPVLVKNLRYACLKLFYQSIQVESIKHCPNLVRVAVQDNNTRYRDRDNDNSDDDGYDDNNYNFVSVLLWFASTVIDAVPDTGKSLFTAVMNRWKAKNIWFRVHNHRYPYSSKSKINNWRSYVVERYMKQIYPRRKRFEMLGDFLDGILALNQRLVLKPRESVTLAMIEIYRVSYHILNEFREVIIMQYGVENLLPWFQIFVNMYKQCKGNVSSLNVSGFIPSLNTVWSRFYDNLVKYTIFIPKEKKLSRAERKAKTYKSISPRAGAFPYSILDIALAHPDDKEYRELAVLVFNARPVRSTLYLRFMETGNNDLISASNRVSKIVTVAKPVAAHMTDTTADADTTAGAVTEEPTAEESSAEVGNVFGDDSDEDDSDEEDSSSEESVGTGNMSEIESDSEEKIEVIELDEKEQADELLRAQTRSISLMELFVQRVIEAKYGLTFNWTGFNAIYSRVCTYDHAGEGSKRERKLVKAALKNVFMTILNRGLNTESPQPYYKKLTLDFVINSYACLLFFVAEEAVTHDIPLVANLWENIVMDYALNECRSPNSVSPHIPSLLNSFHTNTNSIVFKLSNKSKDISPVAMNILTPMVNSFIDDSNQKFENLSATAKISRSAIDYILTNYASASSSETDRPRSLGQIILDDKRWAIAQAIMNMQQVKERRDSPTNTCSFSSAVAFITNDLPVVANTMTQVSRLTRLIRSDKKLRNHSRAVKKSVIEVVDNVLKNVLGRRKVSDNQPLDLVKRPVIDQLSIYESVLHAWCIDQSFLSIIYRIINSPKTQIESFNWQLLFEWLLVIGEKHLAVSTFVSFIERLNSMITPLWRTIKTAGDEVQNLMQFLVEIASNPELHPRYRSYCYRIMQAFQNKIEWLSVVCPPPSQVMNCILDAFLYAYQLTLNGTRQPMFTSIQAYVKCVQDRERSELEKLRKEQKYLAKLQLEEFGDDDDIMNVGRDDYKGDDDEDDDEDDDVAITDTGGDIAQPDINIGMVENASPPMMNVIEDYIPPSKRGGREKENLKGEGEDYMNVDDDEETSAKKLKIYVGPLTVKLLEHFFSFESFINLSINSNLLTDHSLLLAVQSMWTMVRTIPGLVHQAQDLIQQLLISSFIIIARYPHKWDVASDCTGSPDKNVGKDTGAAGYRRSRGQVSVASNPLQLCEFKTADIDPDIIYELVSMSCAMMTITDGVWGANPLLKILELTDVEVRRSRVLQQWFSLRFLVRSAANEATRQFPFEVKQYNCNGVIFENYESKLEEYDIIEMDAINKDWPELRNVFLSSQQLATLEELPEHRWMKDASLRKPARLRLENMPFTWFDRWMRLLSEVKRASTQGEIELEVSLLKQVISEYKSDDDRQRFLKRFDSIVDENWWTRDITASGYEY